ncbi:hypothetical protein V1515DRAFT_580884 [Lipomyces mesembrius]
MVYHSLHLSVNHTAETGYPLWALVLTWSAEVFQDDNELRGRLPAMGSTIFYAVQAWLPLLVLPTPQAPVYKIGYKFTTGLVEIARHVINKFGLAVLAEDLEGFELAPTSGTPSIEEKNKWRLEPPKSSRFSVFLTPKVMDSLYSVMVAE